MQEMCVQSLGGEDPLEKGMAIHSNIFAKQSYEQRNLVGYRPWGCKKLDMTERLSTTHRVHKTAKTYYCCCCHIINDW